MDMSQRSKRSMLKEAAQDGRSTDNFMGHLTKGEIVIPVELQTPDLLEDLTELFAENGGSIDEFTVGSTQNKINPKTGQPEFFWTALAVLAGAALGAREAARSRRQAKKAQQQASREVAETQRIMQEQADAQQQAAEAARQRLEQEAAQFAAEKAKLEEEAKKRQEELEAAQREMGERESARLRASRRSGRRSLLSQARLSPELGLGGSGVGLNSTNQMSQMM